MHRIRTTVLIVTLLSVLWTSCKKDSEVKTTGVLKGVVKDAQTTSPLGNVRIIIFNANTNDPVTTLTTGADGSYSVELPAGSYYTKLYRQGYESIPGKEISAIPFSLAVEQTVDNPYAMYVSSVSNGGWISGKVIADGKPLGGVLVVANDEAKAYSTISDNNGDYAIYNLPAQSYSLKGWVSEHNSSEVTASVSANAESANINIALTKGAAGQVSGQISFLATTNTDIDVTLTHPVTREPIPGLAKMTSGGTYTITNVPNGTYLARATYKNDTKVMDPDWIIKNGEPMVTVSGGTVTRNFSVTGAVGLTSPTNAAVTTEPILVNGTQPTFTWSAYSSTDDYVIEVMDANGKILWGGFNNDYTSKKISIPKSQTSIQYNADETATEVLLPGKVYRWRIYASKNDSKEPTGWKLISVSEDQQGLIKVNP